MLMLSSFSPPPSYIVSPPHISSKTNSTVLFTRNIVIVIAVMFFICGMLHFLVRCLIKRKRLLSSSSNSHFQSAGFQESGVNDGGDALETQLQQLFNLHDSGLDQDFIEALPVFSYKELMGLKDQPFDCAVCLCEFTQKDSLRLLPLCSHAFHMYCIDTWLLSNSTCPLCRGTLFTHGFSVENHVFEFKDSREEDDNDGDGQGHFGHFNQSEGSIGNERRVYPVKLGKFRATSVGNREEKEAGETSNSNLDDGQGHSGHFKPCEGSTGDEKRVYDQGHSGHFKQSEGSIDNAKRVYYQGHSGHFKQYEDSSGNEKRVYDQGHFGHFKQHEGSIGNEKRVYPVKLGKFRATNVEKGIEKETGETSNSNVDARRCYSMGSYEYVVGNSELKVEFVPSKSRRGSFGNKDKDKSRRGSFGNKDKEDSSNDGGNNGKKISNRSKGESFSVSKIWLWSKKDPDHQKSQLFSGAHMVNSSVNVS